MLFKRRKKIIGNWKMFKDVIKANSDFTQFATLVAKEEISIDIGIAAPSIYLAELARKTKNHVTLYAQNIHWKNEGAFTGEISAHMLKSISVFGSLVAHSERRQYFGETNETSGQKIGALIRSGMNAILCVGETLQQRESNQLRNVLTDQIHTAFSVSGIRNFNEFIGSNPNSPLLSIAYEPVWAIGTGKAATAIEAQDAHCIIREILENYFNKNFSERIQILYGGSVNLNNIKEYMMCVDIDGALVGGASLEPNDFFKLCLNCN